MSEEEGPEEDSVQLLESPQYVALKRRWYIVILFGLVGMLQVSVFPSGKFRHNNNEVSQLGPCLGWMVNNIIRGSLCLPRLGQLDYRTSRKLGRNLLSRWSGPHVMGDTSKGYNNKYRLRMAWLVTFAL